MTTWPAPVIRLYLGQITPEAVLAAAENPDADIRTRQVCEASFFIGELALQRDAKDEALRRFRLAAVDCGKNINWSTLIHHELEVLGVQP